MPVPAPIDVETAFLTGPSDTELEDQRERVRLLMDRGALVVLLIAVITFFAAVLNTLRGNFEITHWLFPVVAVLMGAALYCGAQRMTDRPRNSVEVPADLAEVLNDLTIARGEVIATAPRVLNPDELSSVLHDAQERNTAAFDAAVETLKAIRTGDMERASALGTEVYSHTDIIEQLRDDLQREWESAAPIPEGYLGDVERSDGYTDSDGYTAPPRSTDPGYPANRYSASPAQPPADPTRNFWSRPGTPPPTAGPSTEGGMGQSGGSYRRDV
ncbi:MAG: hypothetical protein ACRDPW_06250 [Mycobacteriales bacterium]